MVVPLLVERHERGVGARHYVADPAVQPVVVIPVDEVLQHHLPVPGQILEDPAVDPDRLFEVVVTEDPCEAAERGGQFRRLVIERDEDKTVPDLTLQLGKAEARLVEADALLHRRRSEQLTIEAVDPEVVRAAEVVPVAGALGDDHAAVPANRRENPNLPIRPADGQKRIVEQLEREVVADVGDLPFVADADPVPIEDGLTLEGEERLGHVARRRKRHGLVDLDDRRLEIP